MKSAEYYSVRDNKWTIAPKLNQKRRHHSQCTLDDIIYVFFGENENETLQNSIESINVRKIVTGIQTNWNLI